MTGFGFAVGLALGLVIGGFGPMVWSAWAGRQRCVTMTRNYYEVCTDCMVGTQAGRDLRSES